MKISLIIATYNWSEALELVLLSVLKQSHLPEEIIIADDGSTEITKKMTDSFKNKISSEIKHIWHSDDGFQKTIILNKAIKCAKGDYIIQIDGDMILQKDFITDHIISARKGQFIHGSRALINQQLTKSVLRTKNITFSILQKGIGNRINTIRSIFLSSILYKKDKSLKGTRGCNFSFWKKDFLNVNGYNEDMTGWGKEDTELSIRLMNNDLQKRKMKFSAVCYHLHHDIVSREGLNINNNILQNTIKNKTISCKNGINKYSKRN
jgi:glycosyltransferase involved in cell wall biosynthesis